MVSASINKSTTTRQYGGINRNHCSTGCNFQSYIVSSYLQVNCDMCGICINPGKRVESCASCRSDICYSCKNRSTSKTPSFSSQKEANKVHSSLKTSTNKNENNRIQQSHSYPPPSTLSSLLHRNHHMCMISCILGNKDGLEMEMMVDSGASSSVISLQLAQRLNLDCHMTQLHGNAFGVGRAQIVGQITGISCILESMAFPIDLLVLDGTDQDQLLLLGLDQMRKHKCMIDLDDEVILFGGKNGVEIPFIPDI